MAHCCRQVFNTRFLFPVIQKTEIQKIATATGNYQLFFIYFLVFSVLVSFLLCFIRKYNRTQPVNALSFLYFSTLFQGDGTGEIINGGEVVSREYSHKSRYLNIHRFLKLLSNILLQNTVHNPQNNKEKNKYKLVRT